MEKDNPPNVDSFVWNDKSSYDDDDDDDVDRKQNNRKSSSSSSSWRIDSIRSSNIYDSDPHSLKEPNSHVAWKNELKLTRFANQELPEALWGSNCLMLTHLNTGVRISFCALEALRTWTLMDDEPIIPHLSGRIPDAWDYTYTTNYSGSIEKTTIEQAAVAAMVSTVAAKQPNGSTQYAIRTSTTTTTTTTTTGPMMPLVELRPPMCKCIGGRMICAGVAKSITTTMNTTTKTKTKMKIQQQVPPQPQLLSPTTPPKPSPKWIPCDEDVDGPFDMEGLLNAQRSPPLYYTNQIPLWNQNLDPHSYSFLTVTALVCNNDKNNDDKKLGSSGFIAILLRCFVRVNGVRVRLIDTKYIIRKRKQKRRRRRRDTDEKIGDDDDDDDNNDINKDCDFETTTVVLREQSWKEGSWNEFLTGKKDSSSKKSNNDDDDNNKDAIKLIDLGTDLEQGRRASKNLQHKFPPIVEKLILYDDDDDDDDNLKTAIKPKIMTTATIRNQPAAPVTRATTIAEWIPQSESGDCVITRCSSASGIVVLVVDNNRIMALDFNSGEFLWERNQISPEYCDVKNSPSLLSVAVQQSLKDENDKDCHVNLQQHQQKIVVGDDKGGVHILRCSPIGGDESDDCSSEAVSRFGKVTDTQSFFFSANVDPDKNSNSKNKMVSRGKVQRSSGWVEKVTWSEDGRYFAAAAGKKVTINGEIVQMEGTVYDLTFLRNNNTNKKDQHQLLAVAVYGGLVIVDADTVTISHRRFTVGSSAVLSCAISQDGRSIGIGCLDKRLRIFEKRPTNNNEDSVDDNDYDNDGDESTKKHWSARDWIGFDGGVSCISYSKDNQRLAAIGGTILLVIDRNSKLGEAPVICSCWPPITGTQKRSDRFKSFAWTTKNILVASSEHFVHVFDVLEVVDTVPKRCYPIESIPIEKKDGYVVTDIEGEFLVWGGSKIRKIKVS
jgi:hypothetical protein